MLRTLRNAQLRASARRGYASATASYAVGDRHGSYVVKNVVPVPKLAFEAIELQHEKTGARHVHVARDDSNKVFAVGFKTLPKDRTGLPHILEHTALCGSKRFPVRDPFFKMLTRSLANYMNALTGVDYTFYPFATSNGQDFRNLQSVYLDAVYRPLLRHEDFAQEGWRLEPENIEDANSPLQFKGVVYNEMKGQMSNPAYLFFIRFLEAVYPELQFSGGDPAEMTALKWEDLKEFHRERYHPSNSLSYSYGSTPLAEVLAPLEEYVGGFSAQEVVKHVPQPVALADNKAVEVEGPVDPMFDADRQTKASLTWIVGDAGDLPDTVAWRVLGMLLTDGHAAPFYQALIESGLGSDFSVNTGLEDAPAVNMFSVGLQGLGADKLETFKAEVQRVLEEVARDGFPRERVDAVLNQAELSDREVEADFGMGLVSRLMPRAFNHDNYLESLDNDRLLRAFRARYDANPTLFQDMVRDKLLGGKRLEFVMRPSGTYEADVDAAEAKRLADKVSELSDADRDAILEQGRALAESQQRTEDVSVLPTLNADDISPDVKRIDVDKRDLNINGKTGSSGAVLPVMTRVTGTQGVSYMSLLKNLAGLPAELRPYLPLFAAAVTNVGTRTHDMADLENLIRLHTGGISASVSSRSLPDGSGSQLLLGLGGSALDEKFSWVGELLREVITEPRLDNVTKLVPLIQGTAANSMNGLTESGHRYALLHAASGVSAKRALDETLEGTSQIRLFNRLARLSPEELEAEVVPKLQQIAAFAASSSGIQAGLVHSPGESTVLATLEKFVNGLPAGGSTTDDAHALVTGTQPAGVAQTHVKLPFQVSYVGAALRGPTYTDKDAAALTVLANILTHRHLHGQIREKGGAYGGGATFSAMDGIFGFYSYRDPRPADTVSVIAGAADWVLNYELPDREIREAKLSIFQGIDAPISPRAEISYEFGSRLTNEMRQKRREDLLAVTASDVKDVAGRYLAPALANNLSSASVTVVGPENDAFSSWTAITPE